MSSEQDHIPERRGGGSGGRRGFGGGRGQQRALVRQRQQSPAIPGAEEIKGRDDAAFHPGALYIVETPPSPITRWVVLAIVALFASALAWGYFGQMASNTAAPGKIQASGRTKVLEALAVGNVTKILARDGDKVKQGDILVELDPTAAQAARTIIDQQLTDLRAETLRRKSEIGAVRAAKIGTDVEIETKPKIPWGNDVPAVVRTREESVAVGDLTLIRSELQTLLSQKRAAEAASDTYVGNIKAEKELITVTQENMTIIEGLQKRGYNSKAKYLDFKATLDGQQVTLAGYEGSLENAKAAILVIDSQIASTTETFVTANMQAVTTAEQTIVDLAQQLVKADQALANMTLRAPTDGLIHASAVTTVGQVVKPGQQLMQVVPSGTPLEIQAYISNTDIGFIRVGDPATIKVTAFTYGVYGSVDGTVVDIAKDALSTSQKSSVQDATLDGAYKSTTTAQKTGELQFPIIVRAAKTTMRVEGKDVPLVPGMAVNVEIETEMRRPLDYIVSPILELLSTAGHEK